ncbi:MAG: hypothetical protein GX978_08940 [Tissierellia bacterium]|nr:hypothetical protein [Tissierellia bacterium]
MNIAEKYLLLTLNTQGEFSILDKSLKSIGLLACALGTLHRSGVIDLGSDHQIRLTGSPMVGLDPLRPLVQFLQDNPMIKPEGLVYDYIVRLGNRFDELYHSVGMSLSNSQMVRPKLRDSVLPKTLFIPERGKVDQLIWEMKWELGRHDMSPEIHDLWNILKETQQLLVLSTGDVNKLLQQLDQTQAGQLARQMVVEYRTNIR